MKYTTKYIEPDAQIRLYYDEYGSGKHRLIFLHGGGQTRWAWSESAQSLSEAGYCIWTVDLRGHGDSSWASPNSYTIDHFVDDLDCLIRSDSRPVTLIGASLGGYIALLSCSERLHSLHRRLILVDIAATVQMKGVRRILHFMHAHPEGFDSIEDAGIAVSNYLPQRRKPTSFEGLRRNLRQNNGRWYWHWDPNWLIPWNDESELHLLEKRFCRAAEKLSVPTLLIRGHNSDVISESDVDTFRHLVPHSHSVVIQEAEHMVAGDRNNAFTDAIKQFLIQTKGQL